MASEQFQVKVLAGPEGPVAIPEIRFSLDVCVCGHKWSEHWQPKPGGTAACWATPRGVLCECHDFLLQTDAPF